MFNDSVTSVQQRTTPVDLYGLLWLQLFYRFADSFAYVVSCVLVCMFVCKFTIDWRPPQSIVVNLHPWRTVIFLLAYMIFGRQN
jgi:hypothetical protein